MLVKHLSQTYSARLYRQVNSKASYCKETRILNSLTEWTFSAAIYLLRWANLQFLGLKKLILCKYIFALIVNKLIITKFFSDKNLR